MPQSSVKVLGLLLASALVAVSPIGGATAHGVAPGSAIPPTAFSTSGVFTSDIKLTATGVVGTGNAVTVNLLGLQHDFAGELVVTLSYIDSNGVTVASADVLNRVGLSASVLFGTPADFGDGNGAGDNYLFNSDYAGNLWQAANCPTTPCGSPLGDADVLPGVSTDTTNSGRYFSSTTGGTKTNLSYAFTDLNVSGGTWRLTITDSADPNAGSLVGWEIYVTTAAVASTPQTVTAMAGGGQSTIVGTSFSSALQAKVTDSSANPVSGATVIFAAPASGASATFSGSASASAVTNSLGVASSSIPTANATAGAYSVSATVSGLTPASFALTNTAATTTTSAVYQKSDTSTQGNWKGVYGAEGSLIAVDSTNLPSYASVSFSGSSIWTWAASTSDARALLKYSSNSDRIAATYYKTPSFSMDLNLSDGQAHTIALYGVDWDFGGRSQTITISNATSGAVLDTRTMNSISNGQYLVWTIRGHVTIQFTFLGGQNAVLSGLFFGSGGGTTVAVPVVSMTAPAANASVSGSVTVKAQATSSASIASVQFQVDNANLGSPVTGSGPEYTTTWTAVSGTHTLRAIATDSLGQSTTSTAITVAGPVASSTASATFQKSDTTTQGNWKGVYGSQGSFIAADSSNLPAYATITFSGSSQWTWAASTSDPRALLKYASTTDRIAATYYNQSIFNLDLNLTDGQSHTVALYGADWDFGGRSQMVTIFDASSNAQLDSRTMSSMLNGQYLVWTIQGHVRIQFTCLGGQNAVLLGLFLGTASSTPASPTPAPAVSITAPAANASVSGSVTLTATATSSAGIASVQFLVDGSNAGAAISGAGPSYSNIWTATAGTHSIAAIATDTQGQTTQSATITVNGPAGTSAASATFVQLDSLTGGNWKGAYGTDGSIIANDSSHPPAYATVAFTNAALWTWLQSTSDSRALLKYASSSDRIASAYYQQPSFSIDLNLTDSLTHKVALYTVDWEWGGRSQTITISDATSGSVLDTRALTDFRYGQYLVWKLKGHVTITVNWVSGANGVLAGMFFDPAQ